MEVKIAYYTDMWNEIKNSALFTMGKHAINYPTSNWKRKILRAEHSPIRDGFIIVEVYDIPSFVIGHFVRHNKGFQPYVRSLRVDRATYDKVPDRNTPNAMRFTGNFQSFINISRKRFCNQASPETREVWKAIIDKVREVEPELANSCVRECVYRNGLCPEMKPCNFNKSSEFKIELLDYLKGFENQVVSIDISEGGEINE